MATHLGGRHAGDVGQFAQVTGLGAGDGQQGFISDDLEAWAVEAFGHRIAISDQFGQHGALLRGEQMRAAQFPGCAFVVVRGEPCQAGEVLRSQGPAPAGFQFGFEPVAQGDEIVGVQACIVKHLGRQRSPAPVGPLVAFAQTHAQMFFQQRAEPQTGIAQQPCGQHGVEQVGEGEAKIPLEGEYIVICAVEHLLHRWTGEERRQRAEVGEG